MNIRTLLRYCLLTIRPSLDTKLSKMMRALMNISIGLMHICDVLLVYYRTLNSLRAEGSRRQQKKQLFNGDVTITLFSTTSCHVPHFCSDFSTFLFRFIFVNLKSILDCLCPPN